ncbi:4-azaleucine resistance transporter AzlC [Actinomycetospora succinea]|uniref:4-azaleucine resistance transporter AzlC n=1 Tax=Actinomycetospora succinea TaxID=663603 RepID=A0A4R6V555_9PSEU|nr:AzlC family ABC transporter permease [Actinomycetospora succinea]TDQ53905.1 4-azaleucine resistance transporter AzlC [Actinomycetospora succinea]
MATTTSDLRDAARDVGPVAAGMFLLGTSFGLLVVGSGLAWWWAPVFSGIVFAGSAEFLLVALAVAGTPLAAVAVTTLLVNGRHAFYGLSFPLHRVQGRLARGYAVFALIDEAYALATSRPSEGLTGRRIVAGQAFMQVAWVGGGLVGALAGARFALHVPALDFVFTALFVVLATEAVRAGREATGPLLAVACALVARLVAPGEMLLVAMGLFVGVLLVRHALTGREEPDHAQH